MRNTPYYIRSDEGIDIAVYYRQQDALDAADDFAVRNPGRSFRVYHDGELVGLGLGLEVVDEAR